MINFEKLSKIQLPKFEMPKFSMPKLKIGRSTSNFPIIQGGMGVGISLSGLAASVTEAGGVGVIAANVIGILEDDYLEDGRKANIKALRNEIRKAKKMTDGPVGVNLMVAVNDFYDLLDTCVEENVDMIIMGAGLPIKGIPVEKIREAGVSVVPIVSSARAASLIFRQWLKKYNDIPDAVIVEGPMAGGHLGFKAEQIDDPDFALENLIPEVVKVISEFEQSFGKDIPVIAAGGIFTGEDIYKFIKLGASGVQMGTRFVATDECDADIKFKQAYLNCKSADEIQIIKSPVGLLGRAITNTFLNDVEDGKKHVIKCAWRCLEHCDIKNSSYCISSALDNARKGNWDMGYAFAGSNAYRVNEIVSVKELILSLKNEYEFAVIKNFWDFKADYEKVVEKFNGFKNEFDLAVAKVQQLKEEYENMIIEKYTTLKNDYENSISKIKDEYDLLLEKIESIKKEMSQNFTRVCLKPTT